MTATPFMQLYIADYLGDTQHLTTEQHGAYLLLLMAMWRADGRLPNDPAKLCRIARVSARRWHLIAEDVMAFFTVDGEEITQKRLVEERKKAASISEKRSASGKRGGQAKALKSKEPPLANAKQMPQHSQKPDTKEEKQDLRSSKKKSPASRIPENFQPDLDWAVARGLTRSQAEMQAEKFRNYWLGAKEGAKADWPATWRTWVLNFIERNGISAPAPRLAPTIVEDEKCWRSRLDFGRPRDQWFAHWGPKPGDPGCRVPEHLLKPNDGKHWTVAA